MLNFYSGFIHFFICSTFLGLDWQFYLLHGALLYDLVRRANCKDTSVDGEIKPLLLREGFVESGCSRLLEERILYERKRRLVSSRF